MALIPDNEKQIEAGTVGRKRGHKFESLLTDAINDIDYVIKCTDTFADGHLHTGNPAHSLLSYIAREESINIVHVHAWWLGGLATSNNGDTVYDAKGNKITKCKSDVLLEITDSKHRTFRTGVSVKTCSKKTATNAQMFFTTATAFCKLLTDNGIKVSKTAKEGMFRFCGDEGYRPLDLMTDDELSNRISDPRRYYWEELPSKCLKEWEKIFKTNQDKITRLLFQKAYKNDPYPTDYILHQTVKYESFDSCPVALFTVDEIVKHSHKHSGFVLVPYKIRKGTYKKDKSEHSAPRFGFIQFQRGGQKQHPTQLQFNLKAGYFKHLK